MELSPFLNSDPLEVLYGNLGAVNQFNFFNPPKDINISNLCDATELSILYSLSSNALWVSSLTLRAGALNENNFLP